MCIYKWLQIPETPSVQTLWLWLTCPALTPTHINPWNSQQLGAWAPPLPLVDIFISHKKKMKERRLWGNFGETGEGWCKSKGMDGKIQYREKWWAHPHWSSISFQCKQMLPCLACVLACTADWASCFSCWQAAHNLWGTGCQVMLRH